MHNPRTVASRIMEGTNALLHDCEGIFFILGIMIGVTSEKRREERKQQLLLCACFATMIRFSTHSLSTLKLTRLAKNVTTSPSNLVGTLFLGTLPESCQLKYVSSSKQLPNDALLSLDANALESTYQMSMPQKFKSISS